MSAEPQKEMRFTIVDFEKVISNLNASKSSQEVLNEILDTPLLAKGM